jgi:hypothetical protein
MVTNRRRSRADSLAGRPGEDRTFNARAPPRRRVLRQRITELGAQWMSRPTSLMERSSSSRASARRRRSSSRSAEPAGLGTGVLLLDTHYCILYAGVNNVLEAPRGATAGLWRMTPRVVATQLPCAPPQAVEPQTQNGDLDGVPQSTVEDVLGLTHEERQ